MIHYGLAIDSSYESQVRPDSDMNQFYDSKGGAGDDVLIK